MYNIDFSHLPKTKADLDKIKLSTPMLSGITPAESMSASPDGKLLFTGDIMDFETGKLLSKVEKPDDPFYPDSSIFSYDSKYLATVEAEVDPQNPKFVKKGDLLILRNATTGKEVARYHGVSGGPFFY